MIAQLASLLFGSLALDGPALCYEIGVPDPSAERVEVSVTLSGLDPDRATIHWNMAERYAFVTLEAPRLVAPPRAIDASGQELLIESVGARRWSLDKGAAREVRMEWSVLLDHRSRPSVIGRDEYEFPYLEEEHGMLQTAALLLIPEVEVASRSIELELPEGWPSFCPWPRDDAGVFSPTGERSLASNFFAVGRWSTHEVELAGARVSLLFAPGQERLEQLALPVIGPLVEAELALFGHHAFESYLILFGRPDGRGMGGSPKQASMTLFVQPELVDESFVANIAHLAAHELFHTWSASRFDAPDELRFWNEGFTDYYAHLLPARLEQIGWQDFGAALGGALVEWEQNERAAELSPVTAGGPEFFEGQSAYWLVYRSGLVLAALWDLAIREASEGEHDLDQLMRAFTNDARWSRERAPTLGELQQALAREVGEERSLELVQLARSPGTPDFVAEFARLGVELQRSETESLASLRANFDGLRILDLAPTGLGARLGLREGDEILAVDGAEVADQGELRRRVREAKERVRLKVRRGRQELELESSLPRTVRYSVPIERWKS